MKDEQVVRERIEEVLQLLLTEAKLTTRDVQLALPTPLPRDLKGILNQVYDAASEKTIPYALGQIALGISYAIQTSRVSGSIAIFLRQQGPNEILYLIVQMYNDGIHLQGDVPRWLNKWFYSDSDT